MSYRYLSAFSLLANVRMIATFVEEICRNLRQTLDKTSSSFLSSFTIITLGEFDILLSGNAITWEQIVYISCLIDSYEFKAICLHRQLHDVQSMETGMIHHVDTCDLCIAMSNVTAVRSEKTSVGE